MYLFFIACEGLWGWEGLFSIIQPPSQRHSVARLSQSYLYFQGKCLEVCYSLVSCVQTSKARTCDATPMESNHPYSFRILNPRRHFDLKSPFPRTTNFWNIRPQGSPLKATLLNFSSEGSIVIFIIFICYHLLIHIILFIQIIHFESKHLT